MSKRSVRNDKKRNMKAILLTLLVLIGIGFAVIRSNLNIIGTTNVHSSSWDVHFENYQATPNTNVVPTTEPSTPSGAKPTLVTYEVTLNKPGDIYEFTLDVVNGGSIDAMIESFSSKLNDVEIDNNHPLPAYLEYSVAYDDGISIANKQALAHGTSEKVKLRVKYRDDIATTDLPSTVQDLTFSFTITYVQDDGTSVPVRVTDANFATDSWDNIIAASKADNPTQLQADMAAGTTRAVPLDLNLDGNNDEICNLRIANLSTPNECKTTGFSQTACGLVLECANVIATHNMNSTNTNVGGWPASELRTYLNDETANAQSIYNALPTELSSKIIPTFAVSGHGLTSGETNFTSTDKIYLLSPMEVWGNNSFSDYDSARSLSRQLDYYNTKGVNNSSYSAAIKKNSSNSGVIWWLRAADSDATSYFDLVSGNGSSYYDIAYYPIGVSPAFRIG